jgi:hypothetical protein
MAVTELHSRLNLVAHDHAPLPGNVTTSWCPRHMSALLLKVRAWSEPTSSIGRGLEGLGREALQPSAGSNA